MKHKSIVKNSIFNIVYTLSNMMFPFITSMYVSRILQPNGVGKVAYAQNIASYFVTIAALGLPTYGVREIAKVRDEKDKREKLYSELLLINFLSTSIATCGFLVIVLCNKSFGEEWNLYLACGMVVFFNYINIDWLYQGMEDYEYITKRSILLKILSLCVLPVFVRNQNDYVNYAFITSAATVGNYLFNIFHARKYVKFTFKNINLKRHTKSVLTIAVIVFLSSVYSKIDTTMIGLMSSEEGVGYYTYAQKIISIIITASVAVTTTLMPRLSYYYENDIKGFYELLNKGFQLLCLFAFPACIGLFLVADQIVEILYGSSFLPAALTIKILCPLILVKSFGDLFCYQLIYSTKNEKVIVPASSAASISNVIMNSLFIPLFSQNGAAIASVASETITNIIQFAYVKSKVKICIPLKPLVQAFISIFVMGSEVCFIKRLNLPIYMLLITEVLMGGTTYFLLNICMKNDMMIYLINLVKEKCQRKG